MKIKLKKISDICKLIFGYGLMIVLFAGGFIFLGYLLALMIGGETAATICFVIYKKIVPVMIYASTVLILLGTVAMYMAGELALTPDKKSKK